ncbi:MAG: isoamylase early set domain-containing protein [Bacteroidota bacterium]
MMRLLLFCTALCLITACQPDASLQVLPAQNAIIGLNSPIDVDGSASVSILTQDYFIDPQAIDSIVSRDYSVTLNADKTELQITPTNPDAIPHFASFQVFVAGYPYAFLVQKSKKQPVTFSYPNDPSVKQVSLVGDMTNWQPLPMKKGPNGWASEEYLLPGDYQYKFAVDEPWLLDPNNPDKVGNGFGGFNSLISVYLSDNPAALPQLSTLDHTANVVRIKATNCAQRPLVFLDNFLLGDESLSFNKDILSISLPGDLQKQKRSFLRIYAANEVGPANDLLIPLHFGQVMQDPEQLDRMDKEAMVMYFPLMGHRY